MTKIYNDYSISNYHFNNNDANRFFGPAVSVKLKVRIQILELYACF